MKFPSKASFAAFLMRKSLPTARSWLGMVSVTRESAVLNAPAMAVKSVSVWRSSIVVLKRTPRRISPIASPVNTGSRMMELQRRRRTGGAQVGERKGESKAAAAGEADRARNRRVEGR